MNDSLLTTLVFIAAISAGLMAGVYFAFSTFIMNSFDQLSVKQATNAMNAINKVILRSWFMILFFGSTLLFAILSVVVLLNADLPGRWLLFSAGSIYVLGMFLCTIVFNVPLNNRLEKVGDEEIENPDTWKTYYQKWTRWNHLRGVCSFLSLTLGVYYLTIYV